MRESSALHRTPVASSESSNLHRTPVASSSSRDDYSSTDPMKASLQTKLETVSHRVEELSALLSSEDITRDLDRYRALAKEHSDSEPVAALYAKYREAEADLAAAQEMSADPEMRAYA